MRMIPSRKKAFEESVSSTGLCDADLFSAESKTTNGISIRKNSIIANPVTTVVGVQEAPKTESRYAEARILL